VLLCRVTQRKQKGSLSYVGVDAGMHTLIRPALYGARHHVVNLSRLGEPPGPPVTVVGPICESGDVLARDRRLPVPQEGDVLLFATAGAYGASMSSDYNLRGRAAEVLLPA
jgi:diaminopimelate decarboxylase/aspartate kinase